MALRGIRSSSSSLVSIASAACAALMLLSVTAAPAEARGWRHYHHAMRYAARAPAPADPAFAAIVVDANAGRTLYAANENEPRHPASLTKVMTLYLLFEQLDKGAMTMQTEIPISEHAAAQEPSKLGLEPGDTIAVEDAIKAIVTRSANDVAVAIAEAIGGDEAHFADMMTRKAHALGMSRTLYRNASGLPNDEQITTARDLTILARATEERFPRYFKYFSTHEFAYGGEIIGNHNHLLGRVDGVDGIKTGYTRASGFNLLTSVHRDGRSLVAVVLGGRTAGARDAYMEGLIRDHLAQASNRGHTAPMIAEAATPARSAGQTRQCRHSRRRHSGAARSFGRRPDRGRRRGFRRRGDARDARDAHRRSQARRRAAADKARRRCARRQTRRPDRRRPGRSCCGSPGADRRRGRVPATARLDPGPRVPSRRDRRATSPLPRSGQGGHDSRRRERARADRSWRLDHPDRHLGRRRQGQRSARPRARPEPCDARPSAAVHREGRQGRGRLLPRPLRRPRLGKRRDRLPLAQEERLRLFRRARLRSVTRVAAGRPWPR